jgi:hypothetical protein
VNEATERAPYAREYYVRKQADEAARMALDADPVTPALAALWQDDDPRESTGDWEFCRLEALTAASRYLRLAEHYDRMVQVRKAVTK